MSSSSSSEGEVFGYLCVGFIVGIVGFFRGFKLRTKKKLIENIPTSTVRGMAMGLAEVKGAVRPVKGAIKTPFAKAESVFYYFKIEEHRGSGRSSRWVTVKEFASPNWFYLEDDTGRVLVDPAGAELFLSVDRKYASGSCGTGKDLEAFEQGLVELGIEPHGFMGFHKQLRCTETYLCPGDAVYIMGNVAKNPLVEFTEKGSENLCIQKDPAPFFCISDKSEKDLLSSMGWQMYLFLYGGPILTVTCLFFLITYYFNRAFNIF